MYVHMACFKSIWNRIKKEAYSNIVLKVNIISAKDGRLAIAQAAQALAKSSLEKLESKHTLNPAAQDPNSAHTSCSCAVKQHCSGLARPYQDVTVESLNGVLTSSESTTLVFIDTILLAH